MKKRDAQCSTSVFKSEGRGGGKIFAFFFADIIFAKGMRLEIIIFLRFFFCGKTTPCAKGYLFHKKL